MPVPVVPSYESLTNDEIRDRLRAHNYASLGPVNDLTRKSYLKKLAQLDAQAGLSQRSAASPAASLDSSLASNGSSQREDPSSSRGRVARRSAVATPKAPASTSKSPGRRRTVAVAPSTPASVDVARRPEPDASRDALDSIRSQRRTPVTPSTFVRPSTAFSSQPRFSAAEFSDAESEDRITGFRRRTITRPAVHISAASYEPKSSYFQRFSPKRPFKMPAFVPSTVEYAKDNYRKIIFGVVATLIIGMFLYVVSTRPGSTDTYPVCSPSTLNELDCVPSSELPDALENLKRIKPILERRAFLHDWPVCASNPTDAAVASVTRGLSDNEIISAYFAGPATGTHFAKLRYVAILAHANPHWGVAVVSRDGERTDDVKFAAGLEATSGSLPVVCLLVISLQAVFIRGSILAVIAGVVYLVYYLVKYRSRENERRERAVYGFVEKAIMVLATRRNENPDDMFVPVYEVRDKLIKPSMRNDPETLDLWKRAVHFVEEKEARVGSDTKRVEGYDTRVWYFRGAGASPSSKSTSSGDRAQLESTAIADGDDFSQDEDVEMTDVTGVGRRETQRSNLEQQRVWQGSAFDNNRPKSSPTPCLKIRNMFDPEVETGDQWPLQIQDSLLRKCEGIPIVHIAVDRDSKEGTVYMKCLNEEASGRAYNLLHGQWFDRNLVTVKYLLTDRYHQRFPQARDVNVPISL